MRCLACMPTKARGRTKLNLLDVCEVDAAAAVDAVSTNLREGTDERMGEVAYWAYEV